jgi:hypothetical protein
VEALLAVLQNPSLEPFAVDLLQVARFHDWGKAPTVLTLLRIGNITRLVEKLPL